MLVMINCPAKRSYLNVGKLHPTNKTKRTLIVCLLLLIVLMNNRVTYKYGSLWHTS